MNVINVKTSRQEKAEESKRRIYDAAFDLIVEKGLEKTSITEICRKANCSVGAFYHYFPTKESIIEESFRLADARFSGWERLEGFEGNGVEHIVQYMMSYAEFVAIENGIEFSKDFYTPTNRTFIRKGRAMQERLTRIISAAVDSGELKLELSPEEACDWLFIGARGFVFHWCLHDGDFDLIEKMEVYTRRALKGIQI